MHNLSMQYSNGSMFDTKDDSDNETSEQVTQEINELLLDATYEQIARVEAALIAKNKTFSVAAGAVRYYKSRNEIVPSWLENWYGKLDAERTKIETKLNTLSIEYEKISIDMGRPY